MRATGALIARGRAAAAVRTRRRARADNAIRAVPVADRGAGFDDADKAAALTRFRRADTSCPGNGLGLAICDALVRSGGGALRLEDNEPCGLRVVAELHEVS